MVVQVGTICGTHINYRMGRNLFDFQMLKARTKTKQVWFLELQYAEDCAVLSHSTDCLQETISRLAKLYTRFGS